MSKINFYNQDSYEFMIGIPDDYYDLAIVDPPYGINAPNMTMGSNPKRKGRDKIGKLQYGAVSTAQKLKKGRLNSGGGKLKDRKLLNMNCNWDFSVPSIAYFNELFRVCQNVIIWGGNYFDLGPCRGYICWDKNQPWDNFSQFELAWTTFDTPAAMFRFSNRGGRNDIEKIHPTEKPVELYKWLINKYAKQGDKILDTHGGSGSICLAVYDMNKYSQMNLELDWCEIDKDYFNDATKRFKLLTQNKSLFNQHK